MDAIFSRIKKFLSNTFHQSENLSIKQITKKNFPFFIGWIVIILWLDCYVLPIGAVGEISHLTKTAPTSIFSYLYTIATAVFICLFNVRKLLPYTKFSTVVAMMGVLAEIVFESSPISYIGIVLAAVGLGHIFASVGYGFFMILNNSEKLYSIGIGILLSKIILLLKVNAAWSITGINLLRIMQFIGLVPILICAWFFQNTDSYEPFEPGKKLPLKDYTVVILALFVFIFNDFLAPALWRSYTMISPFTLNIYHAAGVLSGAAFIILVHQCLRWNICYVLNFSFAILTLGFVINILAYRSGGLFLFSAFLFGVSYVTGFISIYYIAGIIAKRSRSLTFYRIGVLLSIIFYLIGFLLIKVLKDVNSQSLFTATALFSIAVILIVFALTPLLTKILYSAEWTDDLHRLDVTYESRLAAHLRELKLSQREIEVCILLLEGHTMRQISAILNIAYSTVNTYYTSIYRKLGVNSRTELIVMFSEYSSR